MSLSELFPVDEISHVELYARLRSFEGDLLGLAKFAAEGVSQHPLPMCQILTVCYQRSAECATFIRSLINSFQLSTDCSLRLLATAVVPLTPDNELCEYIDNHASPFFKDRMVRLLKRSKRHAVIDRLLQTTKNPTNTLAELIHMASSTALGQFYWEYESRKGVNFDAIFRFHAKAFLTLARKSLSDLPWQQRQTFWDNNIFKHWNKIVAADNRELFEGLMELFYDLPPTDLMATSDSKLRITATESLADEYKVLSGCYRTAMLAFAAKCKFSFLFQQLLTNEEKSKCSGPSQLFLPFADMIWKHLLDRKTLKAAEARVMCNFILKKIESFANSNEPGAVAALLARFSVNGASSNVVSIESMQRDFWSSIFSTLTGKLSRLNVLVGDSLNAIVLEKILLIWRGHFEGIKFLTSSHHALVIEQELFSAIRERMFAGIFQSLKSYDEALNRRFSIILESYAKDHSKSKHFHSLSTAFADMYEVYNIMLNDVLILASSTSLESNFYVSFQNLIAYLVEKITESMKLNVYVRQEFKRYIDYGHQEVVYQENVPSGNADMMAFMVKAQELRNLPAIVTWMNSWREDFAQYFIHCADPVLTPTRRQATIFQVLTRTARSTLINVVVNHISDGDLMKFIDYLLEEIIRPCQAFPPSTHSTSSHRSTLEFNGRMLYDLLIAIMARLIGQKQSCVRVMAGLYEVHQWRELLRSTLDTGNYNYVFPFLTKVIRDISNTYITEQSAKLTILTLNNFIGKDVGDKIAANAHMIFDIRKESQCVFDFIEACKSKRIFYPMMQELIISLVNIASVKEEYKLIFDMYRQDNWKKEEAQPARMRAIFEDTILKVLPVNHSLTTRYLKRRVTTCCTTLEDKINVYNQYLDSALMQANVFAYHGDAANQKEIFCQAYAFIHPMVKNVQWNAEGLSYPVNYQRIFELYIPNMKNLASSALTQRLEVPHSIESTQEMISLFRTICNDKLQAEADSFQSEVQTMFASAVQKAFESYAQALTMQACIESLQSELLINAEQVQHYLTILKMWLDFFFAMKSLASVKILGKESAESIMELEFDYDGGYRSIVNVEAACVINSKLYWGMNTKAWRSIKQQVMTQYLAVSRAFYRQYVPKMPLSPAKYASSNHEFSNEALNVIQDFLLKYLPVGLYHEDAVEMLQVLVEVLQNEEEHANRNSSTYYDKVSRLFGNLSFNYVTFTAKKLTPQIAHIQRLKEHDLKVLGKEDALVFNEDEIHFLEIYRNALIELAEKLPVFPTAKFLALNHRIAIFRTPEQSDLEILLNSLEMIISQVCPSIIRYKFITRLFLEHRPQFLVDLLQVELVEKQESSKIRKNGLIIKRNTRYSVPFYTRIAMCLNAGQKKFFEKLFVSILLNTSNESLQDRKNASLWVTHLQTLSMTQLLALYENHLLLGKEMEESESDGNDDEMDYDEEEGEQGNEGEGEDEEAVVVNPALKRAMLIHTLTSSHSDFKQALHTIFDSKYLNDTNVSLYLLNGLSRFAYFYGSEFSEEVKKCLNPTNPAFTKMGVSGFKAIVRLCERLHGSSALLVAFWENRSKFHRDVVVCILKSLLSLYATQGESNQDVTQALYSYAASALVTVQTVNEVDLLQVVMNVIPGEEFIAKEWLQKYASARQPRSEEQTMIVLTTQDTAKAFFERVISVIMSNIQSYHENAFEMVGNALRLWFGFSSEYNLQLRDFYLSFVDNIAVPFVDGEVKVEACTMAFNALVDIVKMAQQSFVSKDLDPSDHIRQLFLRYMNTITEAGSNSKMSIDGKYSFIQKVQLIQQFEVFKVQAVYDKFDKKVIEQMEEFYSALSNVYKKMTKKRRFE